MEYHNFADSDDEYAEKAPPQFNLTDDYPFDVLSHHVRVEKLQQISDENQDFWWPQSIARISMPSDPTSFYREYVAQSKPCIIKNAFDHWSALQKWDIAYLRDVAGQINIHNYETPNGHGDCVIPIPEDYKQTKLTEVSIPEGNILDSEHCFVKPLQSHVKFSDFLDSLQAHQQKLANNDPAAASDSVSYLQHQNDSFRLEFENNLGKDIDRKIEEWGSIVFGGSPDAINFWMGDSRAVSSMHKDHYENLYCVIKGTKVFTLLPPTDFPWLNQRWFRQANFVRKCGKLCVEMEEPQNAIPWIPVDPDMSEEERMKKDPRSAKISPLTVEVHEGEMLYLPAMVYHKVAQKGDSEGKVIAINYWWDMQFGTSYTYFKLLEALASQRDIKSTK